MINIDTLISHGKLDEEFVYVYLLFKTLEEAQATLNSHFPGSTIEQFGSDWVIFNARRIRVAVISNTGVTL